MVKVRLDIHGWHLRGLICEGLGNVPLHIYITHPLLLSLPPVVGTVLGWMGAFRCHRYDGSTLSAREIRLFVCSPSKGVKLSSWQLTRPLDSELPRCLSWSLCSLVFKLHFPPLPPNLQPPSSPKEWKSIPDCPRTTVWCAPDLKMSRTLLLSLRVGHYLTPEHPDLSPNWFR